MRVVCNTDKLLQELDAYYKDTIRRSRNMVSQFAYWVTIAASNSTPLGDSERISLNEGAYYNFYKMRNERFGIDIEPGFHSGAWKFSRSNSFAFDPTIFTEEQAAGQILQDAKAEFGANRKVFYIGAKGPGYAALENGSSPQSYPDGIIKPTLAQIQTVYSLDLATYYRAN